MQTRRPIEAVQQAVAANEAGGARASRSDDLLVITQGRAMRLPWRAVRSLRCLSGHLWLTVDGDSKDHVLVAGDVHLVRDPQRLLVVVALADTVLSITRTPDRPCPGLRWVRQIASRLGIPGCNSGELHAGD